MKKITFGLMMIMMISMASCKKNTTTTIAPDSWTFKGVTYTYTPGLTFTTSNTPQLICTSNSQNSILHITINSPGSVSIGTYTVSNNNTPASIAKTVSITLTIDTGINTLTYTATGGNGTDQSISLSPSSTTGSGIVMKNNNLSSDSAILNFNVE